MTLTLELELWHCFVWQRANALFEPITNWMLRCWYVYKSTAKYSVAVLKVIFQVKILSRGNKIRKWKTLELESTGFSIDTIEKRSQNKHWHPKFYREILRAKKLQLTHKKSLLKILINFGLKGKTYIVMPSLICTDCIAKSFTKDARRKFSRPLNTIVQWRHILIIIIVNNG